MHRRGLKHKIWPIFLLMFLIIGIGGNIGIVKADTTQDETRAFQVFVTTHSTTDNAMQTGNANTDPITKDNVTPLVGGSSTGAQSNFAWGDISDNSDAGANFVSRIKNLYNAGWIVTDSGVSFKGFVNNLIGNLIAPFLAVTSIISSLINSFFNFIASLTFANVVISSAGQQLHQALPDGVASVTTGTVEWTRLVPQTLKEWIADIYIVLASMGFVLSIIALMRLALSFNSRRGRGILGKKAMWRIISVVTVPWILLILGSFNLATDSINAQIGGSLEGLIVNTRGLALKGMSVKYNKLSQYNAVLNLDAQNAVKNTWNGASGASIPWDTVIQSALTGDGNNYTAQQYISDVVTSMNKLQNGSAEDSYGIPSGSAHVSTPFSRKDITNVSHWDNASLSNGDNDVYSTKVWGSSADSNYAQLLKFLTGANADKTTSSVTDTKNILQNMADAGDQNAAAILKGDTLSKTDGTSADNSTNTQSISSLWVDKFIYLASPVGSKEYYTGKPSPEQIYNVNTGGATSLDGKTSPFTIGSVYWLLQTNINKNGGTVTSVNYNPNGTAGAKPQTQTAAIASWHSYTFASSSVTPVLTYILGFLLVSVIVYIVAVFAYLGAVGSMFSLGAKSLMGTFVEGTESAYIKFVAVMAGQLTTSATVRVLPPIIAVIIMIIPQMIISVLSGVGDYSKQMLQGNFDGALSGAGSVLDSVGELAGLPLIMGALLIGMSIALILPAGRGIIKTIILFPWYWAESIYKKDGVSIGNMGSFKETFKQKNGENVEKAKNTNRKAMNLAGLVATGGASAGSLAMGARQIIPGIKGGIVNAIAGGKENVPDNIKELMDGTDDKTPDEKGDSNSQPSGPDNPIEKPLEGSVVETDNADTNDTNGTTSSSGGQVSNPNEETTTNPSYPNTDNNQIIDGSGIKQGEVNLDNSSDNADINNVPPVSSGVVPGEVRLNPGDVLDTTPVIKSIRSVGEKLGTTTQGQVVTQINNYDDDSTHSNTTNHTHGGSMTNNTVNTTQAGDVRNNIQNNNQGGNTTNQTYNTTRNGNTSNTTVNNGNNTTNTVKNSQTNNATHNTSNQTTNQTINPAQSGLSQSDIDDLNSRVGRYIEGAFTEKK